MYACFNMKHKERTVRAKRRKISLSISLALLLTGCQFQPLALEPESNAAMLIPGDSVDGMKLTTGSGDAVPIWAFCSPAFGTWECSVPALPKLNIGTGWWAIDEETRDANWEVLSYSYSLDGTALDLEAFGRVTSDLPLTGLDESAPDKEVIVKLGSWDIVLENLEPGQHTLHSILTVDELVNDGVNELEPGDYEQIVTFTIEE